jgi:lysophospholipase L1-like esterase
VRVFTVAFAFVVIGGAACKPKTNAEPAGGAAASARASTTLLAASALAAAPAAPTAPADAKEAPKPTCAALDVSKVTPFAECTTRVVKTPVPDIVDPKATLASFYDRLAELERGTATRPVRIAIYGDSNLTSDFLPGHLRRVFQERYGDAGHGWVSLSRPWGSYRHEDVVMAGFWPMFKLYAPTTHVTGDKQYGFANMAAESSEVGAAAWAATTKDAKAKVGQNVSRFELHYLKQPRGGSFTMQIDRTDLKTIDTKAPAFEAGIETIDVEDGPHELRGVVKGTGPVRFFGVSLDRKPPPVDGKPRPGFQVDSLGAGALNYERCTWVAKETRKAQLEQRAYDLVVIWLGMNVMFVPPNKGFATEFIGDLRAALPNTPILVLGPGDTAREGETKSDPRIVAVDKQMREVADETGVAFWPFREAMGGDGAIIGFTKRGLTGEDHIHFGPEGSKLMGDRLLCAITTSLSTHLTTHPEAGCPRPGAAH